MEPLVDSQRVEELREDELGQACYGLPDLLRLFAREEVEADQESPAALTRGLRAYLAAGQRADALPLPEAASSPGASLPSDISDELLQDPIRWFESERDSLVAALRQAFRRSLVDPHLAACRRDRRLPRRGRPLG